MYLAYLQQIVPMKISSLSDSSLKRLELQKKKYVIVTFLRSFKLFQTLMRIFIDTSLPGNNKKTLISHISWTETFSNKTWHCIRELGAWKYPRDVPTAGGVQWRAIKYLPNWTGSIAHNATPLRPAARLYIYFLIIDTNPTTDYVLWVDERLTVGLMKFHTGTPAFLTYADFASCRINMLLIVNTGFTVA